MNRIAVWILVGLIVSPVALAEVTPEAKALIKAQMEQAEQVSPEQLYKELAAGESLVLIDVRQKSERPIMGLITEKDVHIPRGFLEINTYGAVPDRDADIVVYCGKGVRSAFAVNTLKEMGYTKVRHLSGGAKAYSEAGYPTIKP